MSCVGVKTDIDWNAALFAVIAALVAASVSALAVFAAGVFEKAAQSQ